MKKITNSFLAACASAVLCAGAHAETLTPEQVADVYLQMIVKQDDESFSRYADYMTEGRQATDQQNADLAAAREAPRKMLDSMIDAARRSNKPREVTDAYIEVLRKMSDAIHRSECQVTGRDPNTTEESAQTMISMHYACKVVDIGSIMKSVPGPKKTRNAAKSNQAVVEYSQTLASRIGGAAVDKEIEGDLLMMHSAEIDRWIGAPDAVFDNIRTAMLAE
ncbi:hypothetical protein [Caballeronia sp. LZ019]|uniref:hypothetical protein n=1 Tax=Caballeronia sp. LZ019 TaxID=3038555 RepID=UPI00285C2E2C|nr:hypothetical protein [Caballeronia sp. LZ019]MDR5810886.1 hypothetical protein [Caballeronia sp. LZ019]